MMPAEPAIGIAKSCAGDGKPRVDGEGGFVVQYCSLELPEALSGESEILMRLSAIRIDRKRLFEMLPRAVQFVDPSERRSERDMILGAPARDHSRTIEQAACLVRRAKPSAHRRQAAQGAKVAGLVGQQATIDLLR
jgi:hypothetical protein